MGVFPSPVRGYFKWIELVIGVLWNLISPSLYHNWSINRVGSLNKMAVRSIQFNYLVNVLCKILYMTQRILWLECSWKYMKKLQRDPRNINDSKVVFNEEWPKIWRILRRACEELQKCLKSICPSIFPSLLWVIFRIYSRFVNMRFLLSKC